MGYSNTALSPTVNMGYAVYWSCSNCGNGTFLIETTEACLYCNHWLCPDCPRYEN